MDAVGGIGQEVTHDRAGPRKGEWNAQYFTYFAGVARTRGCFCLRTVEDELPSENGNLYSFDVPTRR